jgi:NADPH2:quinone reductase
MRALICDDFGGVGSLRVGELADPEPAANSILIEVEVAAVSFADSLMVSGLYQFRPEPPFAPGYEVAGTVLVGDEAGRFSPGDRVCGFLLHGGIAAKAVLEATKTAKLPEEVSFEVGAVIPATYGTSCHALVDRASLAPGETLLVLGAAGGVGLAAVQIGKVLGATVVAAVSSAEKADLVTDAGADQVIRYDDTDLRKGIEEATHGAGADVVYDPVGGEMTEAALRSTNWGGRLLVVGFASGKIPQISMNLPLLKGNSLVGVFWGRFTDQDPDRSAENTRQLIRWVQEGELRPAIDRIFDLDHGAEALAWVAARRAKGKVLIRP